MADAPLRRVRLWSATVRSETRPDGTIIVRQSADLPPYPARLSDRIAHWAGTDPARIWMAERGPDGQWIKVSYADLMVRMRAIGQALLNLNLSQDRPLLILSGNSIAHASLALAAQFAGIPSAAVTPAFAMVDGTFEKLRSIRDQITPGAVFADDTTAFLPAIAAVFPGLPVLGLTGPQITHDLPGLLSTTPTPAIDAANAATGPDTVAKFMFTSGTTGSPKAVIQTQRMLCANMEMVLDCYAYLRDEPPILLDWAPWNHVASGSKVFNMAIYNGGTYYIDGGKPTPKLIGETIRNIREVSPNWYFNVPTGYEMLVEAMKTDPALALCFFRNAKVLMYAGAAMAAHTWDDLDALAIAATGERILLCTGLGATETAPFALFCTDPQDVPGNVGIPAKGLTLKLVPNEGKYEARVKGPSITPGYWRNPDLTRDAFDDEGFYCLGDALRFADPADAGKGFFFDGRTAENFKMATGTWVAVGALRAAVTNALAGLARDVVIVGEGQDELGALLVPFRPALERLAPDGATQTDAQLCAHPAITARVADLLATYNTTAGGASHRITRALFLTEPLNLDAGEVTDKGSVNQRAVLRRRADLAAALYTPDPRVIPAKRG